MENIADIVRLWFDTTTIALAIQNIGAFVVITTVYCQLYKLYDYNISSVFSSKFSCFSSSSSSSNKFVFDS